jgi:uncharacterized membrane protein (DUF4010 family)
MEHAIFGQPEFQYLKQFIISLAIGLLIGLERERSPAAKAGLRTFTLVCLLGTLMAMLSEKMASPWILAAGLFSVGLFIVSAYFNKDVQDSDPGTTTEAALVLCYGLGAIVWFGYSSLAVMLAVISTVLLYFKPELQVMTRSLSRKDLLSILQFSVLTFVILPVLPDQSYGPYAVLNPRQIWIVVVLISGISLIGYIALRFMGQRFGTPLLGLFGGLVSSAATTLVYARHGRKNPAMAPLASVVIVFANLMVPVRLLILFGILSPALFSHLLPAFLLGPCLGSIAAFFAWHKFASKEELPMPNIHNPTELTTSVGFGILYAIVLFISAALSAHAGNYGLYGAALTSGMVDVDAIALSSIRLCDLKQVDVAVSGLALIANMVFKFLILVSAGGLPIAKHCVSTFSGLTLGVVAGLLWQAWV